jgi:redox-sensitive bicupin YhaK (pirin superfamily)
MLVGGAPLDGPRLIWWNMVASAQALIDQAKTDWTSGPADAWRGRFILPPDETEFIPLPEG